MARGAVVAAAVLTVGFAVRSRCFRAVQGWPATVGELYFVGAKGPRHLARRCHQLPLARIPANGALMVSRCDRRATNASTCARSGPGMDPVPGSLGTVALSCHDPHTTRLTDPHSCDSHAQHHAQSCSTGRPEARQQRQNMSTSSCRSSAAEIFARDNEIGGDLISTRCARLPVCCGSQKQCCALQ